MISEFFRIGSQFTTYMSLVNLCDLAGAFISGHLQQHFQANVIGLGCAVLIMVSLIIVTISVWYDQRMAHRMHSTETNDKDSGKNYTWMNRLRNHNRGKLKIVA